jgi:hypothetical protein
MWKVLTDPSSLQRGMEKLEKKATSAPARSPSLGRRVSLPAFWGRGLVLLCECTGMGDTDGSSLGHIT